jgi:PAS domain S-box-containing protein
MGKVKDIISEYGDPCEWSEGARTLANDLPTEIPKIVVVTDQNGILLHFNEVAEKVTGYSKEEVLGKNLIVTFVPAEWQSTVLNRFSTTWSETLRHPHSNPWYTKNGQAKMIEWRCTGVFPPQVMPNARPWVLGIGIEPRS